jgi:hypothetical protein
MDSGSKIKIALNGKSGFHLMLLVNLLLLLVFIFYSVSNRRRPETPSANESADYYQYLIDDLIFPDSQDFKDVRGAVFDMDSLFFLRKEALVLWINSRNCSSCTDEGLKRFLSESNPDHSLQELIIAGNYMPRDLSILARDYEINFPVLIPIGSEPKIFSDLGEVPGPLIFILEKTNGGLRISHVHYIEKVNYNRSRIYFYTIRKKFERSEIDTSE